MIIMLILFLLFYLNNCLEESDFLNIKNNEKKFYKLESEEKENYFLYENKFKGGEISLEFQNPTIYTTEIYIYSVFSKIKKSEDNYINYDIKFSLKEGNFFIINSEISNNNKLYIIIKDIKHYSTSNIFSLLNEKEIQNLKLNEPYIIKKFLSNNELNSKFIGEKNTKYLFSFVNEDNNIKMLIKDNLNISHEAKTSEKITLESTNGIFEINFKNESQNLNCEISLIIHKINPIQLKNFIPETFFYNTDMFFYFYVNLDNLNVNDDNSIILNVDYSLISKKRKINLYGKFTSEKNNTLNYEKYPLSSIEKNILIKRNELDDTIYEIYFKKLENNNFLLLTINIGENEESKNIFLSEKFSIECSKFTNTNLELKEYTFKQQLIRRIPQYYKFKKPKNKNVEFIIQSTSSETFYLVYNDLIIKNSEGNFSINNNIMEGQIIKIDNNKNYENLILILRGFAYADIYIMEIKNNFIYNFNDRNLKSFEYDIGGFENKYIINYYNELKYFEKNLAVLNYEVLSGDCNIYFKNDLAGKINEYLPNENNIIKNNEILSLETNIELFMIKCNLPGKISFNYITDESTEFKLEDHSKKYFSFKKGVENTINFPDFNNQMLYFSIESVLKKEIEFSFQNKFYKLNLNNNYTINQEINISTSLVDKIIIESEENVIVSIFISSKNNYHVLKKEELQKDISIQENLLLIQLDDNNKYKSININFSNINSEIFYSLYYCKNDNLNYIPNPLGNQNYKILKNYYLSFDNPYQFFSKEKLNYYLIFESENLKNSRIKIFYEERKEINDKNILLNNNNNEFEISHNDGLDNNLYLFTHTYSTEKNYISLNLLDKDFIIDSQKLNNGYSIKKYKNLYYNMKFSGSFLKKIDLNCIIVNSIYSQENIDDSIFNKFQNKNLSVNYSFNEKENNIIVTWEKIDNVNYYIYLIPNNINETLINNDCYLFTLKNNLTTKNNNFTTKENNIFINIVAQEQKYNYRIIYKGIKINYESKKQYLNKQTIIFICIIGGFIILILIIILCIKKHKKSDLYNDVFKVSDRIIPNEENFEYKNNLI